VVGRAPSQGSLDVNRAAKAASVTIDRAANLAEDIRARFRAPDYSPPMLPEAALEVHRVARLPDVNFATVARILEKDPLLTARVLRLSRSGAYARPTPVTSIRDAVGRLGLKAIVELVWRAALDVGLFRNPRYRRVMDQLRRHSTVTAYLARAAALFTPVPVEYAFLAGLLHDIGLAAAMLVLGDAAAVDGASDQEVQAVAVAAVHEELSALVAQLWSLPEDLRAALAQHHKLGEGGVVHPVAAVVVLSENLALRLASANTGVGRWDPFDPAQLDLAYEGLELSASQLKVVEAEARSVLAIVDLK
jgi:putative nucleotidyltransferase with HDIG domain